MNHLRLILNCHVLSYLILISSCATVSKMKIKGPSDISYPTTGHIERLDEQIDALIPLDSKIEVLADGFTWTEGPLWVSDGEYLLFSDIPPNKIMKWSEDEGVSTYLSPSGYTGEIGRGGEPGSNGLLLDKKGNLILCQHGDRRMAKMTAPISKPQPIFETIIDSYDGKRFNSPNDAIYDTQGNLYFTDPPYGLEGNMKDTAKELEFQGVFRYGTDGEINLIADDIPRPNGIGLSPNEKTLYVASSEQHPMWTKFDLNEDGKVSSQSIFYDTEERTGLGAPDGLKVDSKGYIWATGPGGVWIFTPEAELLGKIITGQKTSNCAFDDTETYLYMTCDDYLMRIKLK
ncbi:MAG: gluconolactonase [Saprospiraceae bacterium]|jgi:gluconolactonase